VSSPYSRRQRLAQALKSKFAVDSAFNLVSVGLLAVSGLALNFIIAAKFGAQTLGAFNIVYSIYVVVVQLASMGVQASCLKYAAEFSSDEERLSSLLTAALVLTVFSATVVSAALVLCAGTLGRIYGSDAIAEGILWVIPGLWCFALNKLLMGVVNGLRRMKAYAAFTSVRSLMLLAGIVVCAVSHVPGEKLTMVISAAELVLLASLLVYTADLIRFKNIGGIREWVRRHAVFGLKSISLGIMSEVGCRLDILLLGYFAGEYQVGVYSFAAMLVEGFNQLPFVFRRNMDPILTQMIVSGQKDELLGIIKRGLRLGLVGMSLVGAVSVAVYPALVRWVVGNPVFMNGWGVFAVLMTGAVIQATYLPFSGILVQGGYPGYQTIMILGMVLVNLALGVTLIPFFGALGAAVAAAAAYASTVLFLKVLVRRVLGVEI